jgi:hypothetical protein
VVVEVMVVVVEEVVEELELSVKTSQFELRDHASKTTCEETELGLTPLQDFWWLWDISSHDERLPLYKRETFCPTKFPHHFCSNCSSRLPSIVHNEEVAMPSSQRRSEPVPDREQRTHA